MLRILLLAFAVVLFVLLGAGVIDTHVFRWDNYAAASFAGSFLAGAVEPYLVRARSAPPAE